MQRSFSLAAVVARLALGAPSGAACPEGSGMCSGVTTQGSVLLQTEHGVRRLAAPALLPEWATGLELLATEGLEAEWTSSRLGLAQELDSAQQPSAPEQEHFNLVKAARARGFTCPDGTSFPPNSGELKWDCRLSRAARSWSQRMANEDFMAHRHQGSTSCLRTEAEGFPKNKGCGENIAAGDASPQGAIEQLKKSNDHCKSMFEPKFNKLGVGFASNRASTYQDYWTDSFGEWHQAPDESCVGGSPAPSPAPGCADIDTMNCLTYKNQGYCEISPSVQAECKETCGIDGCGSGAVPAPAPAPTTSCADKDGQCAYYKSQGYCASSGHIREQCQRTCGTCGTAGPVPAPAPVPAPVPAPAPTTSCADKDGQCAYYKSQGYCASSGHIREQCQRTCGICGATAPAPAVSCADIDGACPYYKNHGYCASSGHIQQQCKKTCGLC